MLLDLTYRGARLCPCLDKGLCLEHSIIVKDVEVKDIRRAIDNGFALLCGVLFVAVVAGPNWLVFRDVWSISRCVMAIFVAPLWLCHCPIYFESKWCRGCLGVGVLLHSGFAVVGIPVHSSHLIQMLPPSLCLLAPE